MYGPGTAALAAANATTVAGAPGTGPVDTLPAWARSDLARVLMATLILIAGAYLSKFVVRLLGRPIARRFERESVAQIVLRAVRAGVVLFAAVVAATVLGLRPGDVVLSVTVFSAVLGIVLAPVVGNVINGLFVLADQPFEIGDLIELEDGTRGFVEDITIRYTKVMTLDNTFLVIPNTTIREQQAVNFSAEDERTRLQAPLLVTYESDIDAARDLLERAARECDDVIEGGPDIRIGAARYPARPTAYLDEYADDGVLLTLRYWARKPYRLLTVRSKVQTRFWELLEESDADVEIAYPHRQLVFDESGDPARVALDAAAPSEEELPSDATPSRGEEPPSDAATSGGGEPPSDAASPDSDSPAGR